MGLVLLFAMLVETTFSYRANIGFVGATQLADARAAAGRIDQYMESVEALLGESASIAWSQAAFTEADQRAELYRLMKVAPSIDSVELIAPGGKVAHAVSRRDLDRPVQEVFEDRELLKRANEKGAVVGATRRNGLESVVPMAVRGRGPLAHTIVSELNLRNVSEVVTQLAVGKQGHAFLASADGRILAHRDPARLLREPPEALRTQVAKLSREAAPGEPLRIPNADGVEVLTSAISLPRWGWLVVVEEPVEVALAPVRDTMYRLAGIALLGLAMALLLSALLARRLSRPVVALRTATSRISAGEFSSRIDVKTGDEIEEVARDFNAMAAQLEDYTAGLEQKVAEKTAELQRALRVAEDAMHAKSVFLAAASHDLRQPLYAISLLADTLSTEPLSPAAASVLEKQRQAVAVLRTLFDNLLDLSRFDAGEIRPVKRVASLREVLAPCALEHEVICHARGLKFHSEIAQAWVETDPILVRRVAGNLLSNAVRYTEAGTISIVARVHEGRARIEISDTGIGIAPEDQARVFHEFVQLANPARERDKGVGLGLSIVKRIADLLDMHLELESRPGGGTTVRFDIPVAMSVTGMVAEEDLAYAAAGAFKGARIWIVEDDPLVRDALSMQFNAWEARPAFATSASELLALREADGRWPDAAILDDMLGQGEHGLEIARMLRQYLPEERIVLVTGNVDPVRTTELEESGLVVLRKPLASSDLAQWLRQALRTEPIAAE